MQKKEIDKSKKYKTVKGVDVELVHENYRNGWEYLWVATPSDGEKLVFSTNKYGEHQISQLYNLVEFNPLEELSKMPVDTLVKVISKNGTYGDIVRYLSHVSPDNEGVFLFKDGKTSRTQDGTCLFGSEYYSFEIVE